MIRVMSFVALTDEGARAIETFGDTVAKVRETVTATAERSSMRGRLPASTTLLRS